MFGLNIAELPQKIEAFQAMANEAVKTFHRVEALLIEIKTGQDEIKERITALETQKSGE